MTDKIIYKDVLNSSQLEAVMTLEGPVLVIAGAGSGKTRTLVYRVARLVETGVSPENILLLTFTRKAAGEMLERAASLADERCINVSGGTFHSLAHQILRTNADRVGFETSFTILDRQDMEEVIHSLVNEIQPDQGTVRFPKKGTLATILSKSVNLETSVESLIREEFAQFLEYIPEVSRIGSLYRDYKKNNQLMDYDDLLIFFKRLLEDNQDIRTNLAERYRFIMVDEYQDTNGVQSDIVRLLGVDHGNVMVVGDDSQSIYSFRGANYKNMFDFPRLFPGTKTIKLEQNYRSTQPILSFTNEIMAQASERYTKCLFTSREGGEMPKVMDVRTDPEQALFISNLINEFLGQGIGLDDMAVLFRASHHSFELELELTRREIPFVKYGGFKFMESAHIKDLLAHLRVAANKKDTVSWGRILRLIKNIGHKKSQSIINWVKEEDLPPWRINEWPGARKGDAGLNSLADLMKEICSKGVSPQKAVESVSKYYDPMLRENFDNFPKRQKDLEHIIPMAGRYKTLRTFLDDLVLEPPSSSADITSDRSRNRLTLSTVHSAKGLEWSVVFIIWVMEGYFPSAKAYSSIEAIEEERRLMYVAATRAKDRLIICYPGKEELPVWRLADTGYRTGLSSFIRALSHDTLEYVSPRPSRTRIKFQNPFKKAPVQGSKISPSTPDTVPRNLRPGDMVRHPAFGRGVISKFKGGEKVEVLFRDAGKKILHLEHTTLERI